MTHNNSIRTTAAALVALFSTSLLPVVAHAQDSRQKTKNDWRNLAIAAGGLTAFGLLKGDKTLSFLGAAGSLYSLDRYEKDRKSQDKTARARANIFSQPYMYRDGKRYKRQQVTSKGQKYYRFVRG